MSGGGCILYYKKLHTKTSLQLLWLSLVVDMVHFCVCTDNYYKEKPLMDGDLCQFSTHRQESDQPSNGDNIRLWEQKAAGHPNPTDNQRVLDSFMGGSWPTSKSVLPMRAREVTSSHSNQQHIFSPLFPQLLFCLFFPLWLLSTDARISSNINPDVTPFDLLAAGGYSLPAFMLNGRCYEGPVLAPTNLKLK